MAEITAATVGKLREMTNAGMMDCKKALVEAGGDTEKAVEILRKKGQATAAKKAVREAKEGVIAQHIAPGGRLGVLIEVNCETDFVARCDEFREFCKDICLQVCSAAPRWVKQEDVPEEAIEAERQIYLAQAKQMGKPEKVLDKIVDGMLKKWFKDVCLLEQEFVKDKDKTIEELMKELSGKLGEKIVIRRFERFLFFS